MSAKQITFKEGASLNRPPLFEGEHFSFWQARMQIYIQSIDFELWNAITNDSEQLPQKDQHKVEYEVRAKDIILDALSPNELCRVAQYKSAREIWEKLQ